jgi:hypothetical protein
MKAVVFRQEYLPRLTEPFFTTKHDRGGTGLGGHQLLLGARALGQPQFHVRTRRRYAGASDAALRLAPWPQHGEEHNSG